jgi:hypothetical protein
MYGLPKNFDLTTLKGRHLELICFAAYSVYLHFENHLLITVVGAFRHIMAGEVVGDPGRFPLSESRLMRLLTHEVKEIQGQTDGTLHLTFSNGDTLVIFGDNGPYESYHIKHGDKEFTV